MAQMIIREKEMIRISPKDSKKLEYSTTKGRSWSTRFSGSSMGEIQDLNENGKELLAVTAKGLYYSTTDGRSWSKRN